MLERGPVSRILFPAPPPSYGRASWPQDLIWIPRARRRGKGPGAAPAPGAPAPEPSAEDRIPCLLLTCPSARFLVIYFHSNAEDLGRCRGFCRYLRQQFQVHVLAVEYPGYGACPGIASGDSVMENALSAAEFARGTLKWPLDSTMVFGRSIGTGPATALASMFRIAGLILVTPFMSIRELFRDRVGPLAGLVEEWFPNCEAASKVASPTLIIHGQRDQLISCRHGEAIYERLRGRKLLVSPPDMEHNTNLLSSAQLFVAPMFQFFALPGCAGEDMDVPAWAYDRLATPEPVTMEAEAPFPRLRGPTGPGGAAPPAERPPQRGAWGTLAQRPAARRPPSPEATAAPEPEPPWPEGGEEAGAAAGRRSRRAPSEPPAGEEELFTPEQAAQVLEGLREARRTLAEGPAAQPPPGEDPAAPLEPPPLGEELTAPERPRRPRQPQLPPRVPLGHLLRLPPPPAAQQAPEARRVPDAWCRSSGEPRAGPPGACAGAAPSASRGPARGGRGEGQCHCAESVWSRWCGSGRWEGAVDLHEAPGDMEGIRAIRALAAGGLQQLGPPPASGAKEPRGPPRQPWAARPVLAPLASDEELLPVAATLGLASPLRSSSPSSSSSTSSGSGSGDPALDGSPHARDAPGGGTGPARLWPALHAAHRPPISEEVLPEGVTRQLSDWTQRYAMPI